MLTQTINKTSQIQKQQLPYEPIKFVYTQTIGSVNNKIKQILDPYIWEYQDILQPKSYSNVNNNFIYYYLFHIAPIYNWLRKVESQILINYLKGHQINKSGNNFTQSQQNFKNSINNNVNFDKNQFQSNLKNYISQWEIVKLCSSAKIKIQTTKSKSYNLDQLNDSSKNNESKTKQFLKSIIKSNNSINQKQNGKKINDSQDALIKCVHLIKKQKFTSTYTLNNFTPNSFKLQCNLVYCQQCQKNIEVKTQIKKYPFAPIFEKYYQKQFNLLTNLKYSLVMMFGKDKIYIKSSNGIWYEVTKFKSITVSFDKLDIKKMDLFVYQQNIPPTNKLLKKAEIIEDKKLSANMKINKFNPALKQEDSEDSFQKIYKKNQYKKLKINQKKQQLKKSQQKMQIQQQNEQNQQLQEMSKNPLPIILNKKKTDRKVFKQYKKAVQGLLPKPKQKDAYELDYDKGKTKKIHKNKQQFRTADFFTLYKDIKNKQINSKAQWQPNGDYTQKNQGQGKKNKKEQNRKQNDEQGQFQFKISKRFQKKINRNKFSNDKNRNRFHKHFKHGNNNKGNKFKKVNMNKKD